MIKNPIPILDEDLNFNLCMVDPNACEDDTFRNYISNILICLSYGLIELKHFSSAIETLDECISLKCDNFMSDAYFRRSQCRLYNRNSSEEELSKSLNDIKRAIKSNKINEMYNDHLKLIIQKMEDKKISEKNKIECK